jgi:hypothetical protein
MKAFPATLCLLLVSGALTNQATAQSWSSNGPLPRAGHSMVYDASNHRIIMFGGASGDLTSSFEGLNDVWRLYGSPTPLGGTGLNWNQVHAVGTPPAPRAGHAAGYDPTSNRMIVFGGAVGQSTCTNDVWILTNANGFGGSAAWMQLSPSGGPPAARSRLTGVYDPGSNTLMIFGGDCNNVPFSDVWVLSNANGVSGTPTWTPLSPAPGPTARDSFGLVYDPGTNELILFGGYNDAGTTYNDVWVLSNANGTGGTPVWTQLSPIGPGPTPRNSLSATYDRSTNTMTIFGGDEQSGAVVNETWVLSNANGMGGTPAWTQIAASSNILPAPRAAHQAVYDSGTNVMTVFGGVVEPPFVLQSNDVFLLNHANGH